MALYLNRALLIFIGPVAAKWLNRASGSQELSRSPEGRSSCQVQGSGLPPLVPGLPYHPVYHCPLGGQACLLVHTKEPSSTPARSSYVTMDRVTNLLVRMLSVCTGPLLLQQHKVVKGVLGKVLSSALWTLSLSYPKCSCIPQMFLHTPNAPAHPKCSCLLIFNVGR